jgi:hypothetical protein
MTPKQIAEKVATKLRVIGNSKFIDYFDKIDNQIVNCTVTIGEHNFKVSCTVDEVDISEEVKIELIKIINK